MTATTKLTLTEMSESLTGFEEVAVEKNFGADIGTLLETKATMAYRALVAVHKAREGASASDAKKAAMSLTIKEIHGYFAEDEDEVFDEEPVTEPGKDGSPLA